MSKPHSKSTFQQGWFCNPNYSLWISKDASNTSKAYCKLCYKTIHLKSGSSNALNSHQTGQKHQEFEKARKTNAMRLFLSPQSSKSYNVNPKERTLSPQSSLKSAKVGPTEVQEGLLPSFVLDENTLNAEIVWCLNVVKSHHSFRSCDSLKSLFQTVPFLGVYYWFYGPRILALFCSDFEF